MYKVALKLYVLWLIIWAGRKLYKKFKKGGEDLEV